MEADLLTKADAKLSFRDCNISLKETLLAFDKPQSKIPLSETNLGDCLLAV